MANNTMMDAINYVTANKLEGEANKLANKVGDIYAACIMFYRNIPRTDENIAIVKRIVKAKKKS